MYHWVHKTEKASSKSTSKSQCIPPSLRDSLLMLKTHFLSLSILPFSLLLSPTLPSIARHAADELKESMSVGRQGGERRKNEDIRKNSFSESLNKQHGLSLRRRVSFISTPRRQLFGSATRADNPPKVRPLWSTRTQPTKKGLKYW